MEECINFNQRFAVVGLGDTGTSIINYLCYKHANLVKIFDTRLNPPNVDKLNELLHEYKYTVDNNRNIGLHFGVLEFEMFRDIDVIVISPGISIYDPALQMALKHDKQVIGDIELFATAIKAWPSLVIGITGSNGKTTVTTLTGYLATELGVQTLVAGNIGTPVLDSYIAYIEKKQFPELIVLELSSFQLETTYNLHLDAATVLNISEDHLDRYRDLIEYAYAKANIFNNCKFQVLNYDDLIVRGMARHNQKQIWFGMDMKHSQYTLCDGSLNINNAPVLDCNLLQLVGTHNYLNCLASIALLEAVGINATNCGAIDALRKFKGVPHRMQKVAVHNGITFIEDSKGTNVGAVIAGVSGLAMPVHLILGGDGKGQDFSLLRDLVIMKCKSVAVIGQDAPQILAVLANCGVKLIKHCVDLQEAVYYCYQNANSGEAVVLSPACASWDMFDNYKHRAEVFMETIDEIIH